jgi:hypothetical protein
VGERVIVEAFPGAVDAIMRLAGESGGWVCELHPDREWPHGDCAGPGMLRADVDR